MRALLIGLLVASAACGPRVVDVRTAPPQAPTSVEVANALGVAVNVYVTAPDGTEFFVRQVPARTTLTAPVRGVSPGARVTLRARPIDGSRAYQVDNVVLSGTYRFPVP